MEKIATRDAYGKALVELGKKNNKIVVLDADLSGSTRTGWFQKEFPDRHFNVGVAEQNLVGMSAGLALSGQIPFCSSFAIFLSGRAWEIIRNSVAYPRLNVKLVASHAGITVGEDGASHQSVEDISLMRTIPNMRVFVPADGPETAAIIRRIAELDGPCYVRTGRSKLPVIHDEDVDFEPGKGRLMAGGTDVTLVACGAVVSEALSARDILEKKGISAGVINMASIKPIDEDLLVQEAAKTGRVVTVEEHSILGGLGSAVSEVLGERQPTRIKRIGMEDQFGKSGTAEALMDYFGLTGEKIAEKTSDFLQQAN